MKTTLRQLPHLLWDRMLVSDPGLPRLMTAARAGAGAAITAQIALPLASHFHVPFNLFFPGIFVAAMAGLQVNDTKRSQRLVTYCLVMLAASFSLTVGSAYTDQIVIHSILFVVIASSAVYFRSYGPRAMAVGMIAFIMFFYSQFLRPPMSSLPLVLLGAGIGAVVSLLLRETLLRDHPTWWLRNALAALRAQAEILNNRRDSLDLRNLNDIALLCDDLLKDAKLVSRKGAESTHDLRELVMKLEHACETGKSPESEIRELREAADGSGIFEGTHLVLSQAAAIGVRPAEAYVTRHLAVQTGIACTLALVAGHLLSPARWYWAVIAAFVTFARVNALGDTLTRAWKRLAGTLAGVLLGFLLAEDLASHSLLIATSLFICLFVSYYFVRNAYGWMVAFITITVACLYQYLGSLTPQILFLRVELTLVGSGLAALVALFVWPLPTRVRLQTKLDEARLAYSTFEREPSIDHARDVDRPLRALRAIADPFGKNQDLLSEARALSARVHSEPTRREYKK